MSHDLTNELNQKLQELGLEPIKDVDVCPERTAYLQHITEPDWGDKDWVKKYGNLKKAYLVTFHKFFAEQYQYLLYEKGEERVYWMYDENEGVYREVNNVTVREHVMRLLSKEGLEDAANTNYVNNCLARYRAYTPERGTDYNDFDADDTWFHVANGWVNLESLEFESHTPKRLSRIKSAALYDATAVCARYDQFLNTDLKLADDQIRVIDQFSGLCLTNDKRYQKMLTLLGRTGCGKSTLLETWKYVVGDMMIEKKLTELQGDSMRFAGSQFTGKRLCWFDEVDVKKAEMGNSLGTLISGQSINVERKGINGIVEARNTMKCVLTANRLPTSSEIGIHRRLIQIPIKVSFTEQGIDDVGMLDKLRAESSGILNRMIRGLHDLRKMGGFTVIAGHDQLVEEYKISSDSVAEFLDEYFLPGSENDWIETKILFNSYKRFTEGNSFTRSLTPQRFGQMLASQPLVAFSQIESFRDKHTRCWKGLKLRPEYEADTYNQLIKEKHAADNNW